MSALETLDEDAPLVDIVRALLEDGVLYVAGTDPITGEARVGLTEAYREEFS